MTYTIYTVYSSDLGKSTDFNTLKEAKAFIKRLKKAGFDAIVVD
jgi:2',3'-cyclic-nucleotide 2'-phosphodiesterase (5'-nucleotidase family)